MAVTREQRAEWALLNQVLAANTDLLGPHPYASTMKWAMRALERTLFLSSSSSLSYNWTDGWYFVDICTDGYDGIGMAKTLPEAICRAIVSMYEPDPA